MKTAVGLLLISAAAWAQVAQTVAMKTASGEIPCAPKVIGPKIAPQTFAAVESRFDAGLQQEQIDILGFTRALYLPDYGLTLTAEVSLVQTPGLWGTFLKEIPAKQKADLRARKAAQVPKLQQAMREMVRVGALTLGGTIGAAQLDASPLQVVLAVKVKYQPWEDTSGLPAQITMKADLKHAVAGEIQEEVQ